MAYPVSLTVGGGPGLVHRVDSRLGTSIGGGGLLGAVAAVLAIVSWFTILIAGTHITGIRQFTAFYLRWRARALAYVMLLGDQYPPFGDASYPVSLEIADPGVPRDRVAIAFRLLLAIPHFIVLFFVLIGWTVATIAGWFIILFTGTFPEGLHRFGTGALQWQMRVEAYLYLMVDEYPPFSLD